MYLNELVKEYLFDCEIQNYSEKTIENYRKQLNHFTEFLESNYRVIELEQLETKHIKAFVRYYQQRQCKPSYVNDNLKAAKVLCAYAFREGYKDHNISADVRNVKEPKVLIHTFSEAEIKRMLSYYNGNNYVDIRNKLILMVLFDTGIRVSELTNMKDDQIQDGFFIIYGKGNKERVVPMNPAVAKMFVKFNAAKDKYFCCRNADDYVFLSKNGKKLNTQMINIFMKECAEAVHVNPNVRVSPHTCRHTFAHLQLKNGLDLYSLSRLLGHYSVSITQKYLEGIEDNQIIESAKKTSVLGNLK